MKTTTSRTEFLARDAEALREQTLTRSQAVATWRLARAYGHLWAGVDLPEERYEGDIRVGDLQDRCPPSALGGITGPDVAPETGEVAHGTASGRLRWVVSREGVCTLTIHRPPADGIGRGPVCLEATVDHARQAWSGDGAVRIIGGGALALPRHVVALEEALRALLGTRGALDAVLEAPACRVRGVVLALVCEDSGTPHLRLWDAETPAGSTQVIPLHTEGCLPRSVTEAMTFLKGKMSR